MTAENIIELMPIYLNGRLGADQMRQVETAIEASDHLKQELAFLQLIETRIKSEHVPSPAAIGWARLKRDIAALESSSQNQAATSSHRSGTFLWKTAAIAASLVLVMESGLLIQQQSQPVDSYRPLSITELKNTVKVKFAADVSETQLRQLLAELQGRIVDGPSALGIYRLRFENPQSALAQLHASTLVEYAEVANE